MVARRVRADLPRHPGDHQAIREGRGPFRNASVGGVHVHHQVYGIFLLLGTGTAEFAYRPDGPWFDVLAALFGAGAALTLDEFALWLHLDDVYWAKEGRSSVDAVLVAGVIGTLLLVGANPFEDEAGCGAVAVAVTVSIGLLCRSPCPPGARAPTGLGSAVYAS